MASIFCCISACGIDGENTSTFGPRFGVEVCANFASAPNMRPGVTTPSSIKPNILSKTPLFLRMEFPLATRPIIECRLSEIVTAASPSRNSPGREDRFFAMQAQTLYTCRPRAREWAAQRKGPHEVIHFTQGFCTDERRGSSSSSLRIGTEVSAAHG